MYEGIKDVDDHAKKCVALVQQYNKLLTKAKEQFQFLLQVVSEHQNNFHTVAKVLLYNKKRIKQYHIYERIPCCFEFVFLQQVISLACLYCNIILYHGFALWVLRCIGWSLTQMY